jgi:hypothetical protein
MAYLASSTGCFALHQECMIRSYVVPMVFVFFCPFDEVAGWLSVGGPVERLEATAPLGWRSPPHRGADPALAPIQHTLDQQRAETLSRGVPLDLYSFCRAHHAPGLERCACRPPDVDASVNLDSKWKFRIHSFCTNPAQE